MAVAFMPLLSTILTRLKGKNWSRWRKGKTHFKGIGEWNLAKWVPSIQACRTQKHLFWGSREEHSALVQIQTLAQPPQNGFLGRTGRNTQLVESPPACHQFPYRLIRPTGSEFAGYRRT